MKTEKRKYALGGAILPVRIEFPTLSKGGGAHVVDANGRLVKRFTSAGEARAMVARLNEPCNRKVSDERH